MANKLARTSTHAPGCGRMGGGGVGRGWYQVLTHHTLISSAAAAAAAAAATAVKETTVKLKKKMPTSFFRFFSFCFCDMDTYSYSLPSILHRLLTYMPVGLPNPTLAPFYLPAPTIWMLILFHFFHLFRIHLASLPFTPIAFILFHQITRFQFLFLFLYLWFCSFHFYSFSLYIPSSPIRPSQFLSFSLSSYFPIYSFFLSLCPLSLSSYFPIYSFFFFLSVPSSPILSVTFYFSSFSLYSFIFLYFSPHQSPFSYFLLILSLSHLLFSL